MMRISYLSASFVPSRAANSVHVMKICNAMALLGHEVLLNVASRSPFDQEKRQDFIYYGVKTNSFKICKHWFPRLGFIGRMLYSALTVLPGLLSGVDVYYSRHMYSLLFAALTGRPIVLEMHAPPIDAREFRIIAWLASKPNFIGLVVISDALRKIYLELFPVFIHGRIITAHDGADVPESVTKMKWAAQGDSSAFKCGYTGHLYAGRGIDVLVAVAAQLPQINFHIVGGTNSDIEKWRNKNFHSNVYFYGHLPPAVIPQVLNSMDLLLAPYQNEVSVSGGRGNTVEWMSPLKIFEYMAAAKPIVCSDLPVLREVLRHESNALLVSAAEVDEWVGAIQRLALDRPLRMSLADKGYSEFIEFYSWTARVERVLHELDFLI